MARSMNTTPDDDALTSREHAKREIVRVIEVDSNAQVPRARVIVPAWGADIFDMSFLRLPVGTWEKLKTGYKFTALVERHADDSTILIAEDVRPYEESLLGRNQVAGMVDDANFAAGVPKRSAFYVDVGAIDPADIPDMVARSTERAKEQKVHYDEFSFARGDIWVQKRTGEPYVVTGVAPGIGDEIPTVSVKPIRKEVAAQPSHASVVVSHCWPWPSDEAEEELRRTNKEFPTYEEAKQCLR